MEYFILQFDIELPSIWYLGDIKNDKGEYIIAGKFTNGVPFDRNNHGKILVEQFVDGKPIDYTQTYLGVPIISERLAETIQSVDKNAIQCLPIEIFGSFDDNKVTLTGFEILNIALKLNCIDMTQTIVQRYTENHGSPNKIGKISSLSNIRIISDKAKGHHIFRLAEWSVKIVVSEYLKDKLLEEGCSGMKFETASA
jgi:hypothetical protein